MPALTSRIRRLGRRFPARTGEQSRIPLFYGLLFACGVIGLILYFNIANPNDKDWRTLLLTSLAFGGNCLPMLFFLVNGRSYQVPLFELHSIFYAVCFAFGGFLVLPHSILGVRTSEADTFAALCFVLLGTGMMQFGYYIAGAELLKNVKVFPLGKGLNRKLSQSGYEGFAWFFTFLGLTTDIAARLAGITDFSQVTSLFFSFGFFMLLLLALSKSISALSRVAVWALLVPLQLFLYSGFGTGQLAGPVEMCCWISLIVLRSLGRIPIWLPAMGFTFFIVFQPVKSYVRSATWGENTRLGPVATIQAYIEGFDQVYGVGSKPLSADDSSDFDRSFDRINHLITMAAVVRDTPSVQPYAHGATYLPLLTKWIPRVIWPEKPKETMGNDWASRYGYLYKEDTTTSFNLPWLPEMYMNFGWVGVAGIMFALGLVFRLLWMLLLRLPETPIDYALGLVLAQDLVFAETNFSLMMGSVLILGAVLLIVGHLFSFLGLYTLDSKGAPKNRLSFNQGK